MRRHLQATDALNRAICTSATAVLALFSRFVNLKPGNQVLRTSRGHSPKMALRSVSQIS